jgi:molecular chaperone DnaK
VTSSPIIGIDLGTTTSAAAYVDHTGRPTSLLNFEGDILTPSAVLVEDDTAVVGREARQGAGLNTDAYFECFKRNMGEQYEPRSVNGLVFRPELLSALVLARLRSDAQRQLGEIEGAVVTVPAFFDEARRRATRNAGAICGLHVADIINEPTAAAITWAHHKDRLGQSTDGVERILVYDLGGGTFDTTILEVRFGKEYRTVATDGELRLGGHDWDLRLRDHLAEQFRKKTGCDALETGEGQIHFLQLARDIKHSLSTRPKVARPCSFAGHRMALEVERETFETLTADLLDRSLMTTRLLLEDAKLSFKDIHRLLLVGGSTRMPMVARKLAELSGHTPDQTLSADEAVAHGAAIYAQLLRGGSSVQVVNVNSHGIRIVGKSRAGARKADEMIPRNSPLPFQKTKEYPVIRAGLKSISIELCEGEAADPDLCNSIGRVLVKNLPSDLPADVKVAVTIRCRKDGLLDVNAEVRREEKKIQTVDATLDPSRGMDENQISQARAAMQLLKIV